MTRRLLLVLAIGAALVGAPSPVSAASNALLGAQVTPTSGTTATSFVFTVRYAGRFPATSVVANAGPSAVALALVSGSDLDGTWRGSSRLPAGTWPVTFVAAALQGTAPSLAGPTVTVVPEAPATAAPSTVSAPPSTGRSTIDTSNPSGGATASSPPDVAPAAPVESQAPAQATPLPAATSAASAPAAPPGGLTTAPVGGAGAGTPSAGTAGASQDQPTSAAGAPGPSGERGGGGAAPIGSPDASGAPVSGVSGGATDVGGAALFLGLAGLALVALSGSGLLLMAGRRRRSTTPDGAALDEATAATAAVVERRALRRARMRLDEDPIVAAMGLPDTHSAAERRVRRTEKKERSG